MHLPESLDVLVNLAGVIILPTVFYFGNRWSKRLESIDNSLRALVTQVALHDQIIVDIKDDPQSWRRERDEVKAKLKSLEVQVR